MSNQSKNKTLIFIIVVLLLANVALLIYFLGGKQALKPMPDDKNRDRLSEALKNDVGFNDAQVVQYKQLKDAQWELMRAKFDDVRKAKDDFFHLLSVENVSDSILSSSADKIAVKQKALDMQAFSHFKEVRKLCTPGQQPKFDSLVQRMFIKMKLRFMRDSSKSKDSLQKK